MQFAQPLRLNSLFSLVFIEIQPVFLTLFLITHTGYRSVRIHRLFLAPDEEDKVKFERTLVKEFCAGEVSFRAVFTHPLRPMIASS